MIIKMNNASYHFITNKELMKLYIKREAQYRKLEYWLDALSLGAVLQYVAYRFLRSTMFVLYYSQIYKMATMGLLLVFGGARYLYKIADKLKSCSDRKARIFWLLGCVGAWLLALPYFYVGWKHDYKFLIILPICCMCLYDMNAGKVFKWFAFTIGVLFAATVLCCLSGTVKNLVYFPDNRIIAAYGIINTTDFASYLTFFLLTVWCAFRKEDKCFKVTYAILSAVLSYIVYTLTDSRTALYSGIMVTILVLGECIINKQKGLRFIRNSVNSLSIIAFPLIGFVVLLLTYSYAKQIPWAISIDQVLSGRLNDSLSLFQTYGIHAFGNNIEVLHGRGGTLLSNEWSSGYGYIDIAYAMLTIRYGWVITVVFAGLWMWMTTKAIKKGNDRIALAMMVMAFHAFSEARILDINYNIFLAMPFCALQEEKKVETKRAMWPGVLAGIAVLSVILIAIPHILSWFRTYFAFHGWKDGTDAFYSLVICVCAVIIVILLWKTMTIVVLERNKKSIILLCSVLLLIMVCTIKINSSINAEVEKQTKRLNEEEKIFRLVSDAATQPVYAAEPSELYARRFGGIMNHVIPTDEIKEGTIFTDSDVESLGIIITGGQYTQISEKTGVYTHDPGIISVLSNKGYEWTPFYSSKRNVNLKDAALFNDLEPSSGITLTGPCRFVTTNMETDQLAGQYIAEINLESIRCEKEGLVVNIEIMGEANERVMERSELAISELENRQVKKKIEYSTGEVPKVSFAIDIPEGVSLEVASIYWQRVR